MFWWYERDRQNFLNDKLQIKQIRRLSPDNEKYSKSKNFFGALQRKKLMIERTKMIETTKNTRSNFSRRTAVK